MSISDIYTDFSAVRCSDGQIYGFIYPSMSGSLPYGAYRFEKPVFQQGYLELMSKVVEWLNNPDDQRPGLDLRWFPTRKEASLWVAKGE